MRMKKTGKPDVGLSGDFFLPLAPVKPILNKFAYGI